MRKKEKEIKDPDKLIEILKNEQVCRIGFNDFPFPYIIPLHFVYDNNHIFFHCAMIGRKIDLIKKDGHVCFEIDKQISIQSSTVACKWGTNFHSIIGTGFAEIIKNESEKISALNLLMKKYSGKYSWGFAQKGIDSVNVIKIRIEEMKGKESV